MADFQAFNATTHPIVRLENDYNNILAHGLEKCASYIIRKNGSYYEVIKGGTSTGAGTIVYGGADNAGAIDGTDCTAVWQALATNAPEGASIKVNYGGYAFDETVTFPDGTKSLRFVGDGWLGKDYSEGGGYNGTHLRMAAGASDDVLFDNTYTAKTRSIYGLQFENMKFDGPGTAASICFDIYNADGYVFDHCSFFNWGTSLISNFDGVAAIDVPEQPGLGPITRCLFAQGESRYIKFEKNTQVYIQHNIFQSFGDFTNVIYGIDSDKIEIHGNEFNTTDDTASFTEFILVEHGDVDFPSSGWRINNNWVYREIEGMYWIRTAGAQTIPSIVSRDNLIYHGYEPDRTEAVQAPGPYVLASETNHAIQCEDFVMPPSNDPVIDMSDYVAGAAYRNSWAPVDLIFKFTLADGDSASLQLARTAATLWTVAACQCNSGGNDIVTSTLHVPVNFYWKVILGGTAAQTSCIGIYR